MSLICAGAPLQQILSRNEKSLLSNSDCPYDCLASRELEETMGKYKSWAVGKALEAVGIL